MQQETTPTDCAECGVATTFEQVKLDAELAAARGQKWPMVEGEPPEGSFPGYPEYPQPLCGECSEWILAEGDRRRADYLLVEMIRCSESL